MQTPAGETPGNPRLSHDEVARLARLARLRLSSEELGRIRDDLSQVLEYVERLRALPTQGADPLAHVAELFNRLDEDIPGEPLAPRLLHNIAPDTWEEYIRVPKVLGEGGGA